MSRLKIFPPILTILFILTSCAPAASEDAISTEIAAQAPARTQTAAALPSQSAALSTDPTPTSTNLLSGAQIATAQALMFGPHGDGVYQVGVSIATGLWRSIPQRQDRYCYWARRKYDGILLGSHYAPGASQVLVRPTDYEVEFDGCGVWVYMGER